MAATSTHLAGDGGKLKLYSYWRSSCAHRVRIALNLKGLDYEYKAVNLLKKEHLTSEYGKLNPVNCVPTLVDGNIIIAESLAIVLYLDDKYPENPLLPAGDFQKKAINLQAASIVTSGIQPFQNLSVINYIGEKLGSDEQLKWVQSHINKGFTALEKLLEGLAGRYATGDEAQLADVFLAPQIFGGILRFKIDMTNYPTLARLHEAYLEHPAFQAAMPERQPDAVSS